MRLSNLGRTLGRGLMQLLFPGVCCLCGKLLHEAECDFCSGCRDGLLLDPLPSCCRCASTVGPFVPLEGGCTRCRGVAYHFNGALRLGPYEGLLRDAILHMKHWHGESLAEMTGELWAEAHHERLVALGANVVIPIPLHWRRRWTRGYNQSGVLARALARRLRLPCPARWLMRARATPSQKEQSPTGRWDNVRGAFRCRRRARLQGRTVLLVDDVMTTGSTCSDASRALKEAGAASVIVAVLAHSKV